MPLDSRGAFGKTAVKQLNHRDPKGINFLFEQVILIWTKIIVTGQNLSIFFLLRAQERPATLILTVTSGLRITRARHVYNRDAETGNRNFVLELRTIRMRKMCQL